MSVLESPAGSEQNKKKKSQSHFSDWLSHFLSEFVVWASTAWTLFCIKKREKSSSHFCLHSSLLNQQWLCLVPSHYSTKPSSLTLPWTALTPPTWQILSYLDPFRCDKQLLIFVESLPVTRTRIYYKPPVFIIMDNRHALWINRERQKKKGRAYLYHPGKGHIVHRLLNALLSVDFYLICNLSMLELNFVMPDISTFIPSVTTVKLWLWTGTFKSLLWQYYPYTHNIALSKATDSSTARVTRSLPLFPSLALSLSWGVWCF